jgi:hypothetical protein
MKAVQSMNNVHSACGYPPFLVRMFDFEYSITSTYQNVGNNEQKQRKMRHPEITSLNPTPIAERFKIIYSYYL